MTQSVLNNLTSLNLTSINLFEFPTVGKPKPNPKKCKTFPGDADYPSTITWNVLDILTGGALIKTVPLAAPCYKEWPEYNAADCGRITESWSDPHLQ